MVNLVLRVQFASATYSTFESSREMNITINLVGGTHPTINISVIISFSEATATG